MLRNDPLVHFLVIGGLLFAILSWVGSDAGSEADGSGVQQQIVITADQVAALARSAELLQARPPTEAELRQLVETLVRDEVYYRQALALGLDVDDDGVRTRLIEKMQYLTENVADPEPAAAELEVFFAANTERFRIPDLVSFEQVFFSPRMRGESVQAEAETALATLQAGGTTEGLGDSTPLAGQFELADPDRIRILFGDALTVAVFEAAPNEWIGPYESDFGWHLVRVAERRAARDPGFAEVESVVREAYAERQMQQANAAAFARIRADFDIAVQWEAGSPTESWP